MNNLSNIFPQYSKKNNITNNTPNNFNEKVKGSNHVYNMLNGQQKHQMKQILNPGQNNTWNRIQQQKKLSLFGDKDKDKVMNIYDSKPYSKKNNRNVIKKFLR